MALNPEIIDFLYQNIGSSDYLTFRSVVSQLFNYLDTEVKDNPVFDKYQQERERWSDWSNNNSRNWELPPNLEDAKSLAFDVYRTIQENGDNICTKLFMLRNRNDSINSFNNMFFGYLGEVLNEIIAANPEVDNETPRKTKGDIVFIIHGHDNELKREVQLLLNRAGVNCLVLHEQADRGRTIIDKLLEETENAGYAVALLTPDDVTDKGVSRARQNVILEIGYFLGKVGKERIRMLTRGPVEIPSDLQGILYERFDDAGAWKVKLLKEMQAVGIYVDMQSAINSF